jgi:hypothetical protein
MGRTRRQPDQGEEPGGTAAEVVAEEQGRPKAAKSTGQGKRPKEEPGHFPGLESRLLGPLEPQAQGEDEWLELSAAVLAVRNVWFPRAEYLALFLKTYLEELEAALRAEPKSWAERFLETSDIITLVNVHNDEESVFREHRYPLLPAHYYRRAKLYARFFVLYARFLREQLHGHPLPHVFRVLVERQSFLENSEAIEAPFRRLIEAGKAQEYKELADKVMRLAAEGAGSIDLTKESEPGQIREVEPRAQTVEEGPGAEGKKDLETAEAPTIGDLYRQVERLRENRIERQKSTVAELQTFLDGYAGKRFKSFDQNKELAQVANDLAAEAGCELHYNGQVVNVYCFDRPRSKSGDFEVRPIGSNKTLKTQVRFPSLIAIPLGPTREVPEKIRTRPLSH